MSASSKAIEDQVDRLAIMAPAHTGGRVLRYDREFHQLLEMLKPRIVYQIRRYGLTDMPDDADQACAIAVHRALKNYDPAKAQFTTHVTWMIKGELQSLRHRVRLDQRKSAQNAGFRTVSLDQLTMPQDQAGAFEIVDDHAEAAIHRVISDVMARRSLARLMDRIGSPAFEQAVVWTTLMELPRSGPKASPIRQRFSSEQCRQIVRRTYRNCAKVVAA
jgi:RNA polymerase sigma-32 factor